jgi:hypothetical protein
MGVELATDAGPSSFLWTSTFFSYEIEVFHEPISRHLTQGEQGPEGWAAEDHPLWRDRLGVGGSGRYVDRCRPEERLPVPGPGHPGRVHRPCPAEAAPEQAFARPPPDGRQCGRHQLASRARYHGDGNQPVPGHDRITAASADTSTRASGTPSPDTIAATTKGGFTAAPPSEAAAAPYASFTSTPSTKRTVTLTRCSIPTPAPARAVVRFSITCLV